MFRKINKTKAKVKTLEYRASINIKKPGLQPKITDRNRIEDRKTTNAYG